VRVLALHQLLSTHVIRIPYLQRHYAGSDINHDPLYAISLQFFFRTSTRKSSSVKRGRAPSLLPVSSGLELQMLWWHSRNSRLTYVQTRKKNKKMIVRSKTVQKGGALEPIRPLTAAAAGGGRWRWSLCHNNISRLSGTPSQAST
jgi:hypothetical protein